MPTNGAITKPRARTTRRTAITRAAPALPPALLTRHGVRRSDAADGNGMEKTAGGVFHGLTTAGGVFHGLTTAEDGIRTGLALDPRTRKCLAEDIPVPVPVVDAPAHTAPHHRRRFPSSALTAS